MSDHLGVGDDSDVLTLLLDLGLTDGDDELAGQHAAIQATGPTRRCSLAAVDRQDPERAKRTK